MGNCPIPVAEHSGPGFPIHGINGKFVLRYSAYPLKAVSNLRLIPYLLAILKLLCPCVGTFKNYIKKILSNIYHLSIDPWLTFSIFSNYIKIRGPFIDFSNALA